MQPLSLSFFLPLSADRARLLADGSTATIAELGLPELATVLLIQGLAQEAEAPASLEKKLAHLLELAHPLGQAAFAEAVAWTLPAGTLFRRTAAVARPRHRSAGRPRDRAGGLSDH